MAFDAAGFRSAVLKKYPNLTKGQLEQLDTFVNTKQAQTLVSSGKLDIKDVPQDLRIQVSAGLPETSQNPEVTSITDLARGILGRDLAPVTGVMRVRSRVPGTEARYTQKEIEQLVGKLSLENREKLRGSGAISDFESRLLQSAASALEGGLSEQDFRSEVAKIIQQFGGEAPPQTMTPKRDLSGLLDILGLKNVTNVGQDIGAGVAGFSRDTQAANVSSQNALQAAAALELKAQQSQDPKEKIRLLQVAKDIYQGQSQTAQNRAGEFSEGVEGNPILRGLGVGASTGLTAMTVGGIPELAKGAVSGAKGLSAATKKFFSPKEAKLPADFLKSGLKTAQQGSSTRSVAIEKAVLDGNKVSGNYLYKSIQEWAKIAKPAAGKTSQKKAIDDILSNAKKFKGKQFRADTAKSLWDEAKGGFSTAGRAGKTVESGYQRALRDGLRGELERVAPGFEAGTKAIKEGLDQEKLLKTLRLSSERGDIKNLMQTPPSDARRVLDTLKNFGKGAATVGGGLFGLDLLKRRLGL